MRDFQFKSFQGDFVNCRCSILKIAGASSETHHLRWGNILLLYPGYNALVHGEDFRFMIKELREKAGVTQADLAYALGFTSPQYISNIERNISKLPVRHFKKVANVLGCSVEVLIEDRLKDEQKRLRKALGVKKYGTL